MFIARRECKDTSSPAVAATTLTLGCCKGEDDTAQMYSQIQFLREYPLVFLKRSFCSYMACVFYPKVKSKTQYTANDI